MKRKGKKEEEVVYVSHFHGGRGRKRSMGRKKERGVRIPYIHGERGILRKKGRGKRRKRMRKRRNRCG